MTQPGETTGFTVSDHVRAISEHVGPVVTDVLVHCGELPPERPRPLRGRGGRPGRDRPRRPLRGMGLRVRAGPTCSPATIRPGYGTTPDSSRGGGVRGCPRSPLRCGGSWPPARQPARAHRPSRSSPASWTPPALGRRRASPSAPRAPPSPARSCGSGARSSGSSPRSPRGAGPLRPDPLRGEDRGQRRATGRGRAALRARLAQRRRTRAAYLRGAFQGAGSVTRPGGRGGHHLEFVHRDEDFRPAGRRLLARPAQGRPAAGRWVAYTKSADGVTTLLAQMGLHDAVLEYEARAVLGEAKANANRVTNFDAANAGRTATAAARQQRALEDLDPAALPRRPARDARAPPRASRRLPRRARPPRRPLQERREPPPEEATVSRCQPVSPLRLTPPLSAKAGVRDARPPRVRRTSVPGRSWRPPGEDRSTKSWERGSGRPAAG